MSNEWREFSIDELKFMWSISLSLEKSVGSSHQISRAREEIEKELLTRGVKVKTFELRGHYDETPGNDQVNKWLKKKDGNSKNRL